MTSFVRHQWLTIVDNVLNAWVPRCCGLVVRVCVEVGDAVAVLDAVEATVGLHMRNDAIVLCPLSSTMYLSVSNAKNQVAGPVGLGDVLASTAKALHHACEGETQLFVHGEQTLSN